MTYENQYASLDPSARIRTTFEPSKVDYACIRSYDPKVGILQTTLSILLTKLCNELRQSNIDPGDWSAYQHAITECHINLGGQPERSTVAVPPAGTVDSGPVKTDKRNDRRRAKRLAPKAA